MEIITLDQIAIEAERGDMLPTRAADLLVILAGKYSRAADNYVVANARFAQEFSRRRADFKSDTATERAIEFEEIGLTRHHWKYQLKKAEMLITSLKGYVYQKSAEARNEM
jgi:hypothetical protein